MKKYVTAHPRFATVTINMPTDLQQQADVIATQHGETLSELICLALASYLEAYSKSSQAQTEPSRMSLEEARLLMRQFGQGLGAGNAPHNGAQHHDEYLYGHK